MMINSTIVVYFGFVTLQLFKTIFKKKLIILSFRTYPALIAEKYGSKISSVKKCLVFSL
jgi:hypothetical protein